MSFWLLFAICALAVVVLAIFSWIDTKAKQKVCIHENVSCIHGDELMASIRMKNPTTALARCRDCRAFLYDRGRPDPCYIDGKNHPR